MVGFLISSWTISKFMFDSGRRDGDANLIPEWFKKLKLMEYKCPVCIFSREDKKLSLAFCIPRRLQKAMNDSYAKLILHFELNIETKTVF